MSTRLVEVGDADALARLLDANREFLERWTPRRPAELLTERGQRAEIERRLVDHALGECVPRVILDGSRIVGQTSLTGIERGPHESCTLGYLLGQADTGHGHATAAVREMCEIAFAELGLHRVQAATIAANAASQAVLRRCGFQSLGRARGYIRVAGAWRDAILFQRLADD